MEYLVGYLDDSVLGCVLNVVRVGANHYFRLAAMLVRCIFSISGSALSS